MRSGGDFPGEPDWQWLKAGFSGYALLHVDCPFMEAVRRIGGGRLAYLATPYSRITRATVKSGVQAVLMRRPDLCLMV